MEVLIILLAILIFITWIVDIEMFVDALRLKGCPDDKLPFACFIGIVLSPIVLGLYCCTYPDRNTNDSSIKTEMAHQTMMNPTNLTLKMNTTNLSLKMCPMKLNLNSLLDPTD